jgi:hypothetical protein
MEAAVEAAEAATEAVAASALEAVWGSLEAAVDAAPHRASMDISVLLPSGEAVSLPEVQSRYLIEVVKGLVADMECIPADQHCLCFAGQQLHDGCTLADYKIQHGDVLNLEVVAAPQDETAAEVSETLPGGGSTSSAASSALVDGDTAPAQAWGF